MTDANDKSIIIKRERTGSKQLARFRRISILRSLMEQEENREATFAELAAMMREHPWVSQRWPSYSASTAHRDFEQSMDLIRGDIQDLSMLYFSRQVNMLDNVMDTLHGFSNDVDLDHATRISAANSLRGYIDTSIKIFGNYMPKQMSLTKTTFEFTIDDFKKLKAEADAQIEIVDGYVVDEE